MVSNGLVNTVGVNLTHRPINRFTFSGRRITFFAPAYICVCVYVCIYIYLYTYMYVYIFEYIYRHIYTYINIIIMSRYQHGYFWPSLATPPNRLLLLASLLGYIQYLYIAAVCRFELDVLPLLVPVKGSTEVHHLRARPYSSSSVPHVWFV